MESIQRSLPTDLSPVSLGACSITGKEKAVFRGSAGSRAIIVVIACNASAAAAQARHYRFLERARGLDGLTTLIPEAICLGALQGIAYHVEARVPGHALDDELASRGRTALLPAVAKVLRAMNPSLREAASMPLAGPEFHRLVDERLQAILATLDDPELVKTAGTVLRKRLHGIPVRYGLVHGDFSTKNIFADRGLITGLIDWEDADALGLPILDALNYLDSVHRAFNPGLRLADTIPLLAAGTWPIEQERNFLAESYDYLGFDPQHHLEYATIYWLHHVYSRLDFSLACDRLAIKTDIEQVMTKLLRLM